MTGKTVCGLLVLLFDSGGFVTLLGDVSSTRVTCQVRERSFHRGPSAMVMRCDHVLRLCALVRVLWTNDWVIAAMVQ
jgi:hypothetical protein